MKLLIIGPLPNPITGVTIANQTFIKFIEESGIDFNYINTNSKKGITASQGTHFSFSKTIEFLSFYLSIHKVFSSNVIYITPGQTFYGVLKYAPFIILATLLSKPF
ncbi:MAG: glycosyltransferase, partial [Bacteroidota bacterium]